jgi:hypothetical protein
MKLAFYLCTIWSSHPLPAPSSPSSSARAFALDGFRDFQLLRAQAVAEKLNGKVREINAITVTGDDT